MTIGLTARVLDVHDDGVPLRAWDDTIPPEGRTKAKAGRRRHTARKHSGADDRMVYTRKEFVVVGRLAPHTTYSNNTPLLGYVAEAMLLSPCCVRYRIF